MNESKTKKLRRVDDHAQSPPTTMDEQKNKKREKNKEGGREGDRRSRRLRERRTGGEGKTTRQKRIQHSAFTRAQPTSSHSCGSCALIPRSSTTWNFVEIAFELEKHVLTTIHLAHPPVLRYSKERTKKMKKKTNILYAPGFAVILSKSRSSLSTSSSSCRTVRRSEETKKNQVKPKKKQNEQTTYTLVGICVLQSQSLVECALPKQELLKSLYSVGHTNRKVPTNLPLVLPWLLSYNETQRGDQKQNKRQREKKASLRWLDSRS